MIDQDFPSGSDAQSGPVEVNTAQGRLVYERISPSQARLHVQYSVPALRVAVGRGGLAEAVQGLFEDDKEGMHAAFAELADKAARVLSDAGGDVSVTRNYNSHDERDWNDNGATLKVGASTTKLNDRISIHGDVADRKLVLRHIDMMIAQRESDLMALYRQALTDMQARRAAATEAERN